MAGVLLFWYGDMGLNFEILMRLFTSLIAGRARQDIRPVKEIDFFRKSNFIIQNPSKEQFNSEFSLEHNEVGSLVKHASKLLSLL